MNKNKILSFAILALGYFATAKAQQVTFSVTQDNPQDYRPKLNINLELFQMDATFNNLLGMSFNAGTFGHFAPTEKLGVQFGIRKSYLSFAKLSNAGAKGNLDGAAGIYFLPIKHSKSKKMQVVLSVKESTASNGNRVTTTRSIKAPGTKLNYTGLRLGINYKSTGFDFEGNEADINGAGPISGNLNSINLYAGIMRRSLTNLILNVDGYGRRFNSKADEFYYDAIIPISNTLTPFGGGNAAKPGIKTLPVGFRLCWTRYQIAPKKVTGKKFGGAASFEVGYRPYQGWYVTGSMGLTLIKKA